MKRSISLMALLCAIAVVTSRADAQITITAEDVALQLTAGNTLIYRQDSLKAPIDIGSPGATSWDFSGLVTSSSQTLTSVVASSTPHFANFPSATHAFETTVTLQGITGPIYQYLKLGTNFESLGNMGSAIVGTPPFVFEIALKTTNTPGEIVYGLPCTIGTSWTTTYTATQIIILGGAPGTPTITSHDARYIVDAYGPMTLPGSFGTHQALRIRKTDTIQKEQNPPYMATSWIFLAANGASVQIYACDSLTQSGVISTACGEAITWSAPINTSVETASIVPTETVLLQNYPNPFNPTTKIQFTIVDRQSTIVTVFDVLGRDVATLVNEVKEPGTYTVTFDGSALGSGVYFYQLRAGDFTQTKRLMLVR